MKSNGVLVKLSGSLESHQTALVAAAPANHEIQPLFSVAAEPPSHGQAATTGAAHPPRTWVLVKPRADGLAVQAAVQHPWDTAHEIRRQLGARALAAVGNRRECSRIAQRMRVRRLRLFVHCGLPGCAGRDQ